MFKTIVFLTSLCILSFIGAVWMDQIGPEIQEISDRKEKSVTESVESTAKTVSSLAKKSIPKVNELLEDSVETAKTLLKNRKEDEAEKDALLDDLTEADLVIEEENFEDKYVTESSINSALEKPDKWVTIKETEEKLIQVSNMLKDD